MNMTMRSLAAAALLCLGAGLATPAHAQTVVNPGCNTFVSLYPPSSRGQAYSIDQRGAVCINGSISASLSGFTPSVSGARGTPLTVTTSDSSGTLPTGAVVVVTNVGTTNPMYCNVNGVAATVSDQLITANGGWFAFTIPASVTTLHCIATGGSTTANTVGGSGLATGTGGGSGGSGGGGGAVSIASGQVASGAYSSGSIASGAFASGAIGSGAIASGAVASGAIASGALAVGSGADGWDVSTGATTASAATAGSTGSVNAKLRLMTTQLDTISSAVQGAIPVGTNAIGSLTAGTAIIGKVGIDQTTPGTTNLVAITSSQAGVGATAAAVPANAAYKGLNVGGNLVGQVGDPCQTVAKTYTPISITTATTTRIVAPAASKKTYVCYMLLTSAAADNVGIVEGTGGTCGSGTAGVIGGTTAANGPNFSANGGVSMGNGGFAVAATAGTNVDLCLITSAATPLAGHIAWVQQ